MNLAKRTINELNPFEQLTQELFRDEPIQWFHKQLRQNHHPEANVLEMEKSFEIELMVPGFKKENFDLKVENNILTISGKMQSQSSDSEHKFLRQEFSQTSFERKFRLPKSKLDLDAITAAYEDGILRINLPKRKEEITENTRKISIS